MEHSAPDPLEPATVELDTTANDAQVIPERSRTVVYVIVLVVHVVAFLALSILPVWDVIDADRAGRTLAYILNGIGLVTSGLNIAYRPTRPARSTIGS